MKDIIEHIKRYRDNAQDRAFNTHNNPFSKKGYEGQVLACDNILFWIEDNYQECGHTIRDRQGEPGQEYCRVCVELCLEPHPVFDMDSRDFKNLVDILKKADTEAILKHRRGED